MITSKQEKRLGKFIHSQNLMVLSTVTPDGLPESALVEFVARENYELIFDTFIHFRKYKNLKNNPKVSAVIGCGDVVTVQYEGTAFVLRGDELQEYQKIYLKKIPDAEKFTQMYDIEFFKVIPEWIRYTDVLKDPWEIFEKSF